MIGQLLAITPVDYPGGGFARGEQMSAAASDRVQRVLVDRYPERVEALIAA